MQSCHELFKRIKFTYARGVVHNVLKAIKFHRIGIFVRIFRFQKLNLGRFFRGLSPFLGALRCFLGALRCFFHGVVTHHDTRNDLFNCWKGGEMGILGAFSRHFYILEGAISVLKEAFYRFFFPLVRLIGEKIKSPDSLTMALVCYISPHN